MQLRFRIHLIAACAAIAIFTSCTKTNKQGRYIPADAAVVIHVDGKTLSEKLPWEELKKNPVFEKIYSDTSVPAFVHQALDNPENAGIDTKNDLLFSMIKDSSGIYALIEGHIKDAEKFRLFNIDATKGGFETKKADVQYITAFPAIVGFNKEMFAYVIDVPLGVAGFRKNRSESKASRDLPGTCESIFNLSAGKSLGEKEKFSSLVTDKNDVHIWLNAEELFKDNSLTENMPFGDISKIYEGNIITAAVNFDNGKIAVHMKTYYGKELTSLYKKYMTDDINADIVKNIPSKNVTAFLAMNIQPQIVPKMLELTKMDAMVGIATMFLGVSLDDVIKATKGDFMIAISDINMKPDTSKGMYASQLPDADVLLAASINDKEAWHQLSRAAKKLADKRDYLDTAATGREKMFSDDNGKYFAFGSRNETVAAFLKGGNNSFEFFNKIKGNPTGGYVNLQEVLKAAGPELNSDSTGKKVYDASVKTWNDIYLWGGKYDDGGFSTYAEVNLMDKTTNSLKQLNQYLGLMAQLKMDLQKKKEAEINSIIENIKTKNKIPPPPPPIKKSTKKAK